MYEAKKIVEQWLDFLMLLPDIHYMGISYDRYHAGTEVKLYLTNHLYINDVVGNLGYLYCIYLELQEEEPIIYLHNMGISHSRYHAGKG